MKTADAVVIGAGINGASTAFNLKKRGLREVVLLEKYLGLAPIPQQGSRYESNYGDNCY